MELPSLFSSAQPDSVRKLFIAILVTETSVQASLWEVSDGSIVVLERSDTQQYQDLKNLVAQTDKCLQDLGKDSENVDEVIFGLEPGWVDKAGIVDERKPLLKKITDELSLKAVGFVVTEEALLHHLVHIPEMQSVILLRFDQTELHVSIIKQGKILGTKKVGKSGQTPADLTEAFARFEGITAKSPLPLKVLLFSTSLSDSELNAEEQSLIEYDWVTPKTFTQPPLFELLPPNLLIDVVSREGGKAVAQSLGLLPAGAAAVAQTGYDNLVPVADEQVNSGKVPLPTSFGIPIAETAVPAGVAEAASTEVAQDGAKVVASASDDVPPLDDDEPPVKTTPLALLTSKFRTFWNTHSQPGAHKKFIIVGFVGGVLALLVFGYLYLFLTTKAVAKIELKTTTLTQEAKLTLDPDITTADVATLTLPAREVSQEVSGSDSTVTTGTKLVGDSAKGKATIFNKTTSPKTFAAGTTLNAGNLKFTLDSEVTVASASAVESNGTATTTFGKSDANITAAAIGTESNLGKDTNFTVATFDNSTYSATNPEALAGGASREVRVVSAEDRQKLLAQLKATLVKDSQAAFKENVNAGTSVVPTGKFTVTKEEFNAKVGDEVNQLTLTLTGKAEGLAYQNQDLQPISQAILSSQLPQGFELVPDELQVLSTPEQVSSASAKVSLTANVSSKARPTVLADELKALLAGKSLGSAQELLQSKPEVKSATFTFMPPLAERILGRLPPAGRLEITFN